MSTPPVHQVQIYDSSWGGWRWYDGLTEREHYGRVEAIAIARQAAARSATFRFRVINTNSGDVVRVCQPGRRGVTVRPADWAEKDDQAGASYAARMSIDPGDEDPAWAAKAAAKREMDDWAAGG